MNLQDLLGNAQILEQLARGAGVDQRQAASGLEALLPAVTRGIERNANSASGLESLVKALGSGGHERVLDSPDLLSRPETRLDGNAILGHVFGSKDVSRNVAGAAAQSSGIDSSLLKKMLPIVASIAMGALARNSAGGTSIGQQQSSGGGLGDLLGPILGSLAGGGASAANDSPLDDILDLAKKFL